ncbi:MAG TPA: DUF885 family protein [Thermomicrobiaceae bacterium]|nr:DUF885 family protein [Thermomicrobiaceae bacterium]
MSETAAPAFAGWLDDFFAWYARGRPVDATFIGLPGHDERLPDWSEHGLGDALAGAETLLARLADLPPEPLDTAEMLDRQIAAGHLRLARWELTSSHFMRGNPSLAVGEAVFGVMSLFLRDAAGLPRRVESAVARLEAIPTFLRQARAFIGAAPVAWTERAVHECDGTLAFLSDGVERLIADQGLTSPRLRPAAARAAAAVGTFRAALVEQLARGPAMPPAAGADALALLIRDGHFLDEDAAAVEALGWERLAASDEKLARQATELGYPSRQAALAALAEQHPTTDGYLARFGEVWDAHRAAALAHDLVGWPAWPVRYVPRPAWSRSSAPSLYFLFYRAPAALAPPPVVDYLLAPLDPALPAAAQEQLLRATNDSVITLNHVVHHGGLGHHVQNWYAYHAARSRIGRVAAVDGPGRIALFAGGTMAEGWACYATDLIEEIGFLSPLERVAQQHSRLRMAARAIADVRLHQGRWTLAEAAGFYRARTAMGEAAARAEAVKNSIFPGTALMYLMGTEQIHRLRAAVERREGADFTLRRFHDRLLGLGSVPVALAARTLLDDSPTP